jgi:hypothetical protein
MTKHSDRRRASHAPRGRGILRLSPTVVTIRRASQRHLLRPARIFGEIRSENKDKWYFAGGAFVPPVVIPLLSVLAIVLWATYKAVM